MTPAYFDSSVLLSALIGDTNAEAAASLWQNHPARCSSVLMEVECLNVIRRYTTVTANRNKSADAEGELRRHLHSISLKKFDDTILAILRDDKSFSQVRSLDSIHAATAVAFREQSGLPMTFCTFDKSLGALATTLGFTVTPDRGVEKTRIN